jgi:uncharacterized Zn finger protein
MKRKSRFAGTLLIAAIILCLAVADRCQAQSKKLSTDELVQGSEVVARGKVRELKTEWNESRSRIQTRVTLSVDEYLKGGSGATMDIFVPGGEIGSVGEVYSHVAKFSKDEEVVVFANKDRKGRFRVSGGGQGKFTVTKDERTGRNVVSNYWLLDEFKTKIQKAVHSQGRK